MKKNDSGVLTLEACIVVPVFVAVMLIINGLFVMTMGQQIMAHTLMQSAKSLALDPYSSQKISQTDETNVAKLFADLFALGNTRNVSNDDWYDTSDSNHQQKLVELVEKRFKASLRETDTEADNVLKEFGISNMDFSGCSLDDSTRVLTVKVKYTQEYIFNALDLASFQREISIKIKLFEYKSI